MEDKKMGTVLHFADKGGVIQMRSEGTGKELICALSNLAALVGISIQTPGRELAERLCRVWTEDDMLEQLMGALRKTPGKVTRVRNQAGLEELLAKLAKDKEAADDGTAV